MPMPHHYRGGFRDLMGEMSRMRSAALEGSAMRDEGPATPPDDWYPAVDVSAAGEDLVIYIDVAGVPPEDVELRVSEGVLSVSGHRAAPPEGHEPLVRERSHGQFRRAIALPGGSDTDRIRATFDNGVLTVLVPSALSGGTPPGRLVTLHVEGEE